MLDQQPQPVQLTAVFKGVMLPSWLAICLAMAGFLGAVAFFLGMFVLRDATLRSNQKTEQLSKEIRILQVHVQDIENVLIRARLAERKDFIPWDSDSKANATNDK